MTFLPKDVQRVVDSQSPRYLKAAFRKEFNEKFEAVKLEMIQEFLNHPVTVEIRNGPGSDNVSGTLGGQGDLFSFIGFYEEDDPIEPILKILDDIRVTNFSMIKSGWSYTVEMPTSKDIFAVTPMPWASGRSWAKGIESGISGLGYMLRRRSEVSRSGEAIQIKTKLRGGKYKPVPYISSLINKYTKKLSKIK
jgi:hypothetical protein